MRYWAATQIEDGSMLVEFPGAPGCVTFGENANEARAAAREALEGWLEAHLDSGRVPPVVEGEGGKGDGFWVEVPPRLAVRIAFRRARLDAGLTQAELARRADMKQPFLARLEGEDGNVSLETMERVADALDLEIEIALRPKVSVSRASSGAYLKSASGSSSGSKTKSWSRGSRTRG